MRVVEILSNLYKKPKIESFWGDITSDPIDNLLAYSPDPPTTLSTPTIIGEHTVTVDDPSSFAVEEQIGIFSGPSGEARSFFAMVQDVTGNVITFNAPLDFTFTAGDPAVSSVTDLSVVGSSASPIPFGIQAGGVSGDLSIDVVRIMLEIITTTLPKMNLFGDLPKLANGICLRRVRANGEHKNFWTIRSNEGLKLIAYDLEIVDEAKTADVNGVFMRTTYAGPEKHGTVIRLDPGDKLEMLVQDDLSGLVTFRVLIQGHVVED